jgi:hypothetical protein
MGGASELHVRCSLWTPPDYAELEVRTAMHVVQGCVVEISDTRGVIRSLPSGAGPAVTVLL